MLRRRDLVGAGALLASGVAGAQTAAPRFAEADLKNAEKIRELALADKQCWTLLQQLVNDIGPRPAGSANDAKAVAWAQGALRGLGLANVRAEAVPLRIWQRGPASARLLPAGGAAEDLVMAALGNSVAAPPEGLEAEIAWYPDLAALKADGNDPSTSRARGRIVFIDQKMERAKNGSGYGPAVAARTVGAVEAARRGAVAVGIRSIGTDRQRIAHTGAMRYETGVPRIPSFAVSSVDADRIAALQSAGKPMRLALKLDAKSDVDALSHNVIAEVPGTDLADEIVLIGGHLDSWDLGRGAQDDGAGVTIVAAAAAVLMRAGVKPRRTVRVVMFANEENGLDGALAYGDRYKDVKHQLVGESDFGSGLVWQLNQRVQPAAVPLFDDIARLLAPLGVAWADGAERNRGNPGADTGVLMRRYKWPGLALNQDGTNYFDIHHTEHDTLDRIDPATLPQNVACWAVAAWLAAQSPLSFGPPVL